MLEETKRAVKLASDHFEYIKATLLVHGVVKDEIDKIAHHYITAMIHGYKHAISDERNGMFRPKIGEPLTTGEIAAIAGPCSDCLDSFTCGGHYRKADGICLYQRPREGK